MNIGIITYDNPHLKTEQVTLKLLRDRQDEITLSIFALPFKQRPQRKVLISHRPDQQTGTHPKVLADSLQIPYILIEENAPLPSGYDYFLITGAGILSKEMIAEHKVINAHPGLIPLSRGLDAFKWAILNSYELGNTLHFISHEVDKGEIIHQEKTPVFKYDTIESLARRHYEIEIDMMSNFLLYLNTSKQQTFHLPEGPQHMRMPYEKEKDVIEKFRDFVEIRVRA